MIATKLPGSADFHAVGYNEHKVSKGLARLIEMRNFGTVGLADRPTTEELTGYRAAEEGTYLRDGFLACVGAGYPPPSGSRIEFDAP